MNKILDGKIVANTIKDKIKTEIDKIKTIEKPCIAVIRVETNNEQHDFANKKYINNKQKACEYTGIISLCLTLHSDTTEEELIERIKHFNSDNKIHGIMVQQPLPEHINPNVVNANIDPSKDVDGFSPYNLGQIMIGGDCLKPCTPNGIMELFEFYNINLIGKNVVVVGRSNIVGKPLVNLLINAGATVTCCNSKTVNLKEKTTSADIVITAIGKAKFFDSSYFKNGQVLIDVGINFDEYGKMSGDIDFNDVINSFDNISITPVPGGVGQLTVAMLLSNVLKAYKKLVK